MLDLSERGLDDMLQAAAARRDTLLASYEDLIDKYATSAYEGNSEADDASDWLENHPQQYVGLVKTRMIYSRPRVKCWSEITYLREIAEGIRHALDWTLENTTSMLELQEAATHVLFNWAWVLAVLDEAPGSEPGGPLIPRLICLDQREVIADDRVKRGSMPRFISHEVLRDKDDLLAEAEADPDGGWNMNALRNLPVDEDTSEDLPSFSSDMRNQVRLREIHVPELQPKNSPGVSEGFNGAWLTMAVAGSRRSQKRHVRFVRKPRGAFCHHDGPYTLFGASRVPTKFYPLAPLVAQYHQVSEANRHVTALSQAMDKFRNVVLYDERDRKTAERLKNSRDQEFVGVPNLQRGSVVPASIGGPAPEQLDWVGMLLQRVERASGLTTWMQGLMSGDPTATEANIAFTSGSMRFAELEINFEQAVTQCLRKLGHLAYYSEDVRMPLGEEAAAELGLKNPIYLGGGPPLEAGIPFTALRLGIEPTSMRKVDESVTAARTLQTIDLATGLLPLVAQYPSFPWSDLMGMAADQLNTPELAELFTAEVIEAIVADAQAQMEAQAQMGAQGAPARGSSTANMGGGSRPNVVKLGGSAGQKAGKSNLLGRPQASASTDRAQKARRTRSGADAAAKTG